MKLTFTIVPKDNEELELIKRILEEIGKQNILDKR